MREITATVQSVDSPVPWSHWSEFGALLDLPKIPGEELTAYRTRLLDVIKHRGGAHHTGLAYAMTRELGLSIEDAALTLTLVKDAEGMPSVVDLEISVRPDGILLTSDAFEVRGESHRIPIDTLKVRLSRELAGFGLEVKDEEGEKVSSRLYRVDWLYGDLFFDRVLEGETVTVSYRYGQRVPLTATLTATAAALSAITTPGGDLVVSAVAKNGFGNESAQGLLLQSGLRIAGAHAGFNETYWDELRLGWTSVVLRALGDPVFLRSEESPEKTYHGTRLMRWIEASRNLGHVTWAKTRFDEDRWGVDMGILEVPTLADAKLGHFACPDPTHTRHYSAEDHSLLSGRCPEDGMPLDAIGLRRRHIASGVGESESLEFVVGEGDKTIELSLESYYDHISSAVDFSSVGENALIEDEF